MFSVHNYMFSVRNYMIYVWKSVHNMFSVHNYILYDIDICLKIRTQLYVFRTQLYGFRTQHIPTLFSVHNYMFETMFVS